MPPFFSVITVVRNDAKGFSATAASLIQQSCRDYEWIVIDGKSTDGTWAEIEKVRPWLTFTVSEPDKGCYDAMNKGLEKAQGKYVYFLNAGDTLIDSTVLAQVQHTIEESPQAPDFMYGDSVEYLARGGSFLKKARLHHRAWYGMFTHHQAMFYRREVVTGLIYDASYPIGADYAFTLEALKQSRTIVYYPQPICFFGPAGLSARQAKQGRRDQYRIRREILGYSVLRAWTIQAFQGITFAARHYCSGLYARIR